MNNVLTPFHFLRKLGYYRPIVNPFASLLTRVDFILAGHNQGDLLTFLGIKDISVLSSRLDLAFYWTVFCICLDCILEYLQIYESPDRHSPAIVAILPNAQTLLLILLQQTKCPLQKLLPTLIVPSGKIDKSPKV